MCTYNWGAASDRTCQKETVWHHATAKYTCCHPEPQAHLRSQGLCLTSDNSSRKTGCYLWCWRCCRCRCCRWWYRHCLYKWLSAVIVPGEQGKPIFHGFGLSLPVFPDWESDRCLPSHQSSSAHEPAVCRRTHHLLSRTTSWTAVCKSWRSKN